MRGSPKLDRSTTSTRSHFRRDTKNDDVQDLNTLHMQSTLGGIEDSGTLPRSGGVSPRTIDPNSPTNPYLVKRVPCKLAVIACDGLINHTSLRSKIDTDPYILIYNDRGEVISKSTSQRNTVNPRFSVSDTTVALAIVSTGSITIQVWHKHHNKTVLKRQGVDSFLGEAKITAEDIAESGKVTRLLYSKESTGEQGDNGEAISREELESVEGMGIFVLPLEPRTKEPDPAVKAASARGGLGTVTVAVAKIDPADFEIAKALRAAGAGGTTAGNSSYLAGEDLLATQPTRLVGAMVDPSLPASLQGSHHDGTITIIGADNVLKRDTEPNALSDPYAVVYFPSKQFVQFQTETIDCCLQPRWKRTTPIQVYRADQDAMLIVELWNANPKPEKDNFLGEARIRTSQFPDPSAGVVNEWRVPLEPRKPKETDSAIAKLAGRLGHLVLRWEPNTPPQVAKDTASPRDNVKRRTPSSAAPPSSTTATGPTPAPLGIFNGTTAAKRSTWLDEEDEAMLGRLNVAELNPALLRSIGAASSTSPRRPGTALGEKVTALPQHPSIYFEAEPSDEPPYYAPPRKEMQGPRYVFYGDTEEARELQKEYFHSVAPLNPSEVLAPPPTYLPGETATTAPIALTNIVPVQLVHRGTSTTKTVTMDVDAPTLRPLLKAAEDAFHIHPSSQMLLHCGELLNPLLSLRRNGVLLLKGHGAVQVVVKIWKGQRACFRVTMPNGEIVPVAIDTEWTVRELKQMIAAHVKCPFDRPSEMQVIFRYNRLNDKMRIDYYRIPNRSVLQVVSKESAVVDRIKADKEWVAEEEELRQYDDPLLADFQDSDLIGAPRRRTALELRREKRTGHGDVLPDVWKPARDAHGRGEKRSIDKGAGDHMARGEVRGEHHVASSHNNVSGARGSTDYTSNLRRVGSFHNEENDIPAGSGQQRVAMGGGQGDRPPLHAPKARPTSAREDPTSGRRAATRLGATVAERLEKSPYLDPVPTAAASKHAAARARDARDQGLSDPLPPSVEGRLAEVNRYEANISRSFHSAKGFMPTRETLEVAARVGQHRTFASLQEQLDYEQELSRALWEFEDINMASLERVRELETTQLRFDRMARHALNMPI